MPKSKERCQEIREETKAKILHESILYFARNGFAGTKISNLAKQIGIAQGTLYIYFSSKEDLFQEIYKSINNESDIKELRLLANLPMTAKMKIQKLSDSIIKKLKSDKDYAAKVTLNTQMMFEGTDYASEASTYQSDIYKYTEKMIRQGQREHSVVDGSAQKLADYYWSVVYLYALKELFTKEYEMIDASDLARILLRDRGIKK